MSDERQSHGVESFRREFVQFEKRFETFTRTSQDRFNRVERKVDQIPWLLIGIVINLLLSLVSIIGIA